jgi:signal transduction histidine kinase
MDRLFQPFQRLGTDRTNRGEGLGLGLSIVQAIADAHSASVVARQQPKGGLLVEVTFPDPEEVSPLPQTPENPDVKITVAPQESQLN